TTQEYTGVYRDFGLGTPACPWETWWVQVSPSNPAPLTTGNLLISEFRLRGPQGVRDEFVELYNSSDSDLIVTTTDNSDGGGLAIFKTATIANFTAGTRMDSAGFAGIAAGLFKEGTGIPNISATTPAGQMTFYRDLISGSPQDTDANENDFIFADPVFETLT